MNRDSYMFQKTTPDNVFIINNLQKKLNQILKELKKVKKNCHKL
jgi:hypothetical protein